MFRTLFSIINATISTTFVNILKINAVSGIIYAKNVLELWHQAYVLKPFSGIIYGIASVKILRNKYIFGINYAKKVV